MKAVQINKTGGTEVLEMVTSDVAEIITKSVKVQTIGIGSGINCDGQVLVILDMPDGQKEVGIQEVHILCSPLQS